MPASKDSRTAFHESKDAESKSVPPPPHYSHMLFLMADCLNDYEAILATEHGRSYISRLVITANNLLAAEDTPSDLIYFCQQLIVRARFG